MTKQESTETTGRKKYIPALGYHFLTPLYDSVIALAGGGEHYINALIGHAQFDRGSRVLDVACGTGTLAIAIKRECPDVSVVALDCDHAMLLRAVHKAGRAQAEVQFDRAYAEHLPYPDNCFDHVVSSLFFHHLMWGSKQQVAREIFRVLKPGGTLHVLDWGRASNGLMRSLFYAVQLVDGFSNTQDNVSGRLLDLFEQAGFSSAVQLQSFNTLLGTLALYGASKQGAT